MTPNDKLPVEITDQIKKEANKHSEIILSGRLLHVDDKLKSYIAGATAWAGWKVKHDELQAHAQLLADALEELVELKRLKEESGRTNDYMQRQPDAWAKAATVLQQWKDGKKEVENG